MKSGIYIQAAYSKTKKEESLSKGAKKIYTGCCVHKDPFHPSGHLWAPLNTLSIGPVLPHPIAQYLEGPGIFCCVHEGVIKEGGPAWTSCIYTN